MEPQKYPIYMSAFELGVVTGLVADQKQKIPNVWKQLMEALDKFRKDAGVEITHIGNDMVQLKDKDGITIVRPEYEWEK